MEKNLKNGDLVYSLTKEGYVRGTVTDIFDREGLGTIVAIQEYNGTAVRKLEDCELEKENDEEELHSVLIKKTLWSDFLDVVNFNKLNAKELFEEGLVYIIEKYGYSSLNKIEPATTYQDNIKFEKNEKEEYDELLKLLPYIKDEENEANFTEVIKTILMSNEKWMEEFKRNYKSVYNLMKKIYEEKQNEYEE